MTKEELIEFLKSNLRVRVTTTNVGVSGTSLDRTEVQVELYLIDMNGVINSFSYSTDSFGD